MFLFTIYMRKIPIFLFLLFSIYSAEAQRLITSFVLDGTITQPLQQNTTVRLIPAYDENYYHGKKYLSCQLDGSNFTFKDSIAYPTAYVIGLRSTADGNWEYLSDMFFLEAGKQTVACNYDAKGETPDIDNKTMQEYLGDFRSKLSTVNKDLEKIYQVKDSLQKKYKRHIPEDELNDLLSKIKKLEHQQDMILYRYAMQHPSSYVVLWKIVELLQGGYEPIYDTIYSQLTPKLRNCYTGVQLKKALAFARSMSPGHPFPKLEFTDTIGTALTPDLYLGRKYTLINFWYSGSFTCLRQVPALRKLYDTYKSNGFQIVGISVDDKMYGDRWKKTIVEQKLNWPQLWDVDRQKAIKLSIDYFPTNYLLDEKGNIVRKNIKPEELEKLLGALQKNGLD